jgi:hypothetical protein
LSVVGVEVGKTEIRLIADSAVTTEDFCYILPGMKTHSENGIVVGAVGSPESLSLFRFFIHEYKALMVTEEFDVLALTGLMITFYDFLLEKGLSVVSETIQIDPFQFLVVTPYRAFLTDRYCVYEIPEGTSHVIGSGAQTASVALSLGKPLEEAMETACHFNPWCSLPLEVIVVKRKEVQDAIS